MTQQHHDATSGFDAWSEHELAKYLRDKAGLGDYYELLIKHKVTGRVAPRLTDADLKEMGISNIGDRKLFGRALEDLQNAERKQNRQQVLWEGQEVLFFSCWDGCTAQCCGLCPIDAPQYQLTRTHLVITTIDPCRVGCIMCCCNHKYEIDHVDLTHVVDADVKGVPAPCIQQCCCCGSAQDHIVIKTRTEGNKMLKLKKGEGLRVAQMVTHQIEEAQQMERD